MPTPTNTYTIRRYGDSLYQISVNNKFLCLVETQANAAKAVACFSICDMDKTIDWFEDEATFPPHTVTDLPHKFLSVAYWPAGTFPSDNDVTTDRHPTEESAVAVCQLLERNGAGGNRQVFPLRTEVKSL